MLAKGPVAVGELVKPGDLLADIETDKATIEFESVDEGRITTLRTKVSTSSAGCRYRQ